LQKRQLHFIFQQALQKRQLDGNDLFGDANKIVSTPMLTSLSMLTSTPVRAKAGLTSVETWNSMSPVRQLQLLYEVAR
jgi:hypothetical protein